MKLGKFDERKAKDEAISFLSKSISTLSAIMGISTDSFDSSQSNPYGQDSQFYSAYECLRNEVIALEKLTNE